MRVQHPPDGEQAGVPARLQALEHAGAQEGADHDFALFEGAGPVVAAPAVAGHVQGVDALCDVGGQARGRVVLLVAALGGVAWAWAWIGVVQVVALGGQVRPGEGHRRAVGKDRVGVLAHDEPPVPAHAHHVGQPEQKIRVEVLGVVLVGAGAQEQG